MRSILNLFPKAKQTANIIVETNVIIGLSFIKNLKQLSEVVYIIEKITFLTKIVLSEFLNIKTENNPFIKYRIILITARQNKRFHLNLP